MLTDSIKVEISCLTSQLEDILDRENVMWKQRNKAQWFREGDCNTAFFHSQATKKMKYHHIDGLYNQMGLWCQSHQALDAIILDHFVTIFSTSQPSTEATETVLKRVRVKVTKQMNDSLLRTYYPIKVTKALAQMHPLKSPCPDGMSPIFLSKILAYCRSRYYLLGSFFS